MPPTDDSYNFKIDDVIVLKITGSEIPALEVTMPPAVCPIDTEECYKSIKKQFDIEKMINAVLNKNNKIKKVVIKNEVCRADRKVIFQISELKKYKINNKNYVEKN